MPNDESEYVEPTWKEPKVAGEYWAVLDEFCGKLSAYHCKVAAGDFLDTPLPNVFNEYLTNKKRHVRVLNPHWTWIQKYLSGMEHVRTASYWAWHAYEDGNPPSRRGISATRHKTGKSSASLRKW